MVFDTAHDMFAKLEFEDEIEICFQKADTSHFVDIVYSSMNPNCLFSYPAIE